MNSLSTNTKPVLLQCIGQPRTKACKLELLLGVRADVLFYAIQ
jgi:hypothetical protein